jgi:hypothetical protein
MNERSADLNSRLNTSLSAARPSGRESARTSNSKSSRQAPYYDRMSDGNRPRSSSFSSSSSSKTADNAYKPHNNYSSHSSPPSSSSSSSSFYHSNNYSTYNRTSTVNAGSSRDRTNVLGARNDTASRRSFLAVDEIDFDANPHLRQLKLQGVRDCELLAHDAFDEILSNGVPKLRVLQHFDVSTPKAPYRKIPHERRTVNHWGQRKLMLSEVEFLTRFYDHDTTHLVVYAGAAPGCHTTHLAQMFPKCNFILVDPADFKVNGAPDVRVTSMTPSEIETAAEWPSALRIILVKDFFTGKRLSSSYRPCCCFFLKKVHNNEKR